MSAAALAKAFVSARAAVMAAVAAFFLAGIGLNFDLSTFREGAAFTIVIVIAAVLSKLLACGAAALPLGKVDALRVGVGMKDRTGTWLSPCLCEACGEIVAANVQAELDALAAMMHGMTEGDAAVIFPEGSRANPAKRERELSRLAERHPERHERLGALRHLIPPKPAGAQSMLGALPGADVITVWHQGLDGLDTFPGMLQALSERKVTAHVVVTVHPRSEVPADDGFTEWIDRRWVEMDDAVSMFVQAPGV